MGQMEDRMESHCDAATKLLVSEPPFSLPDLIAGYGDRLLRSAYLMCGRSGDAQDIVQETFCRALASLPDFRGESGVYTWLFTIMRNIYLKQLRRERRFFHFLARQPRASHAEGDQMTQCERQSTQTHLLEALQKLSVKQREIIILRFVNEMKIADIARVLSLPEGTVKSRLFNAGTRLQALMGVSRGRSLPLCEEAHEL